MKNSYFEFYSSIKILLFNVKIVKILLSNEFINCKTTVYVTQPFFHNLFLYKQ